MTIYACTNYPEVGHALGTRLGESIVTLPRLYNSTDLLVSQCLNALRLQLNTGDTLLLGWGSPNEVPIFSKNTLDELPTKSSTLVSRSYQKFYNQYQAEFFHTHLLQYMLGVVAIYQATRNLGVHLCVFNEVQHVCNPLALALVKDFIGSELKLMAFYQNHYSLTSPYLGLTSPEDYYDFMMDYDKTTYVYHTQHDLGDAWLDDATTHWAEMITSAESRV